MAPSVYASIPGRRGLSFKERKKENEELRQLQIGRDQCTQKQVKIYI